MDGLLFEKLQAEGFSLDYGHDVMITDPALVSQYMAEPLGAIQGANMIENEYAPMIPQFGNLFFFITGFHGFHVLSGVVINLIILINVKKGVYDERGHFEMVEKSWIVLALCRFSMGVCIYILLSSIII